MEHNRKELKLNTAEQSITFTLEVEKNTITTGLTRHIEIEECYT